METSVFEQKLINYMAKVAADNHFYWSCPTCEIWGTYLEKKDNLFKCQKCGGCWTEKEHERLYGELRKSLPSE